MTDPILHDKLTNAMRNELPIKNSADLTEREIEILRLIATGTSNKDIARQLFISSNTVKVHLRNIFAKIGVVSRTEAAMYAVRTGFVQTAPFSTELAEVSGEDLSQSDLAASNTVIKTTLGHSLFSRQWFVVVLVILALGFAAGMVFYLNIRSAPLLVATALPSPTPPSRWKRLADMPAARSGQAVAAYENNIYVIGGEVLQGVTGAVESYDSQKNSWQKMSSKPLAVSDVGAAVIGGKIFVPGGRVASGEVTNILEIFDPRQDRWEQGATMPTAISAYALVAFEGRLYLFGGWDGKQYLDIVLVYDPSRDEWSVRTPMPTRRGFAGAAVAEGKIYVVGGYNGKNALTVNEVYYPDRDNGAELPWGKAANIPAGRYAMGISSLTDLIYMVGGKGDTEAALPPLLYIPQSDSWETFEDPPLSVGGSLSLVPLGNYLYIMGGKNARETFDYTLAYQAVYTVLFPVVK